jgi:hypothetical protein
LRAGRLSNKDLSMRRIAFLGTLLASLTLVTAEAGAAPLTCTTSQDAAKRGDALLEQRYQETYPGYQAEATPTACTDRSTYSKDWKFRLIVRRAGQVVAIADGFRVLTVGRPPRRIKFRVYNPNGTPVGTPQQVHP